MRLQVLEDEQAVAQAGAELIAAAARAAVAERGRFAMALSGGRTPTRMLAVLARAPMPWDQTQVFQVDERVAPPGDPARNLNSLQAILLQQGLLDPSRLHAMPVEAADFDSAAEQYSAMLRAHAGSPAVLDLVHLGLGADGHTASLAPDSPELDEASAEVAVTRPYLGHRRMTLTYPPINRARQVLWLVTGDGKKAALQRLRNGDRSIPAGRVERSRATVIADRAAAG